MGVLSGLIKKAVVFSFGPLLAAVASLVALPALTQRFGTDGWAAIAIGLSVGTAASVLVELGWSLDGPPRVSRASPAARKTIYVLSALTKLVAFPFACLAAGVVSVGITSDFHLEAAITAIATAALGLSSAWFFVGTGSPWLLTFTESVPKVGFTLLAAGALYAGMPLVAYPILLLLGPSLSFALAIIVINNGKFDAFKAFSLWRVACAIRGQMTPLRGRAASALYLSLPTAILGLVAPSAVATFAASDRLQRMVLTFLQIIPNSILGWAASEYDFDVRWKRTRTAIIVNSALGLLAGAAWIPVMGFASKFVFSGKVVVPFEVVLLSALLIWVTCTSRAVGGIGLVTFNRVRDVSDSAVVGAVIGAFLFVIFGYLWGAFGAFIALDITELVVLIWQLVALCRTKR